MAVVLDDFGRRWLRGNHEGYPDPEWPSHAEAIRFASALARSAGERMLVWRTSGGRWRVCPAEMCRDLLRGRRR